MRQGIVRLEFHGAAVSGDSLVQLPLLFQGGAQIRVRVGEVGLQLQGPAIAGYGVVRLPQSRQPWPRL